MVWLYYSCGINLRTVKDDNKETMYDAFVSYSISDEVFINQIFVPNLNTSDNYYRLCLQHRDLPPDTSLSETWTDVNSLCTCVVMVVSQAFLDTEFELIKQLLHEMKGGLNYKRKAYKVKPIIVLLEELSSYDLTAVPDFRLLLKTSIVIRWNETGFWNKFRFYLPFSGSNTSHHPTNTYTRARPDKDILHRTMMYHPTVGDTSPNCSTSTYSTMAGSASPRGNLIQGGDMRNITKQRGMINPLEQLTDMSDYSYEDSEHLYQTLDPVHTEGEGDVVLEVMLPDGQIVPATLVRRTTGHMFGVTTHTGNIQQH